ncbi:MAG: beta-propeller domain-containing protein [Deltaproteobacteria bacterium]|nr:beta-propeller domain-containing protein [Deltaproteobacteria bacterium]
MKTCNTLKMGAVIILAITIIACGQANTTDGPPKPPPPPKNNPSIKLTKYNSASEALEDYKNSLIEQAKQDLESYATCDQYYYYDYDSEDGQTMSSPTTAGNPMPSTDDASSDAGDMAADAAGTQTSAPDSEIATFTGTNLQEDNVDESDIIKTDGQYIYVATDLGIDIFLAWPTDQFKKLATYKTSNKPQHLYLDGEQIIAISSPHNTAVSLIRVEFINVSDPAKPELARVKEIEGILQSSRLVDGVLHLVLSSTKSSYYYTIYPDDFWQKRSKICTSNNAGSSPAALTEMINQAVKENEEAIAALTLDDVLPAHGNGGELQPINCADEANCLFNIYREDVYKDDLAYGITITGLISLDTSNKTKETITLIRGSAHQVYASTESVYFVSSAYLETEENTYEYFSRIHKFSIKAKGSLNEYFGSGMVAGSTLNSFSMGEYKNTFRVATTTGSWGNSNNQVFVLDATDQDLKVLGKIENIAEGETIYAARFFGDRGYLVTFKKIDPFFVIDLKDPANPVIKGELKMPGFSSYLHILNNDHVIGLGKDGDDMGDFAWFQGLKLATFDVTDDTNPVIDDEVIIGGRGTDSYALTDHHAFTFDRESGILAIPLDYHSKSAGGNNYGAFEYKGVHLYSISDEGEIDTLAEIEMPSSGGQPKRTILMGDDEEKALFVINRDALYLYSMSEGHELIDSLELSNDGNCSDDYYSYDDDCWIY